jgi:hypothetical protein
MSVVTRATRRNIPKSIILHSYSRKNFKYYKNKTAVLQLKISWQKFHIKENIKYTIGKRLTETGINQV